LTTTGEIRQSTAAVKDILSMTAEIKELVANTSTGMTEVQKFADLMTGSSQKRGKVGETFVRSYLSNLPKELWEEQFQIPGGQGRVD